MQEKIDVFFKNKHVGTLARAGNKYAFQYTDEWVKNGFSISPFSLPLTKDVYIPSKITFDGFFGVFADSLPDAWGKLLLERYLKKHKITDYNGLYRLACIGNSGMGALEYRPNFEIKKEDFPDLDEFQKEADIILSSDDGTNIDLLYAYGGSSGGARPKALVKYNNEDWIIKFQSKYDIKDCGLCEYEYAITCKEIGINIPEVKLFPSKENKGYFGIKRFDRKQGEKIHMITVSALLEVDFNNPCLDYLDLFKLTKIITRDNKDDIKQLFLRMCFNVYAHNLDDHTKNFSFIYDMDTMCYRLSPAYDMTFSNTYYNEHTTSVNHKGKDITDDDLLRVGLSAALNKDWCLERMDEVKKIVHKNLGKYLK